jgi:hypothetical protein
VTGPSCRPKCKRPAFRPRPAPSWQSPPNVTGFARALLSLRSWNHLVRSIQRRRRARLVRTCEFLRPTWVGPSTSLGSGGGRRLGSADSEHKNPMRGICSVTTSSRPPYDHNAPTRVGVNQPPRQNRRPDTGGPASLCRQNGRRTRMPAGSTEGSGGSSLIACRPTAPLRLQARCADSTTASIILDAPPMMEAAIDRGGCRSTPPRAAASARGRRV